MLAIARSFAALALAGLLLGAIDGLVFPGLPPAQSP